MILETDPVKVEKGRLQRRVGRAAMVFGHQAWAWGKSPRAQALQGQDVVAGPRQWAGLSLKKSEVISSAMTAAS